VRIDIIRDSQQVERLEIIGTGRRRRFSKEMKLRIVAESYSEPGLCATTARRHEISRSQLYEWRRLVRAGRLVATGFLPAIVGPDTGVSATVASSVSVNGRMEVVSATGRRVIVDRDVDVEALLRVMRGLETLR
jgi:transposase